MQSIPIRYPIAVAVHSYGSGTRPSRVMMGGQNATFAKIAKRLRSKGMHACSLFLTALNQPSRDEPGGAGNVSRTGSWSTYL